MSDSILDSNTICLVLELGALGVHRKVATSSVDTRGTDPELVSVNKEILTCKSYDRLCSAQGELKREIRALALPSVLFSRGSIYMLPVAHVERADEKVRAAQARILTDEDSLLEAFMSDYAVETERARYRLGQMFDPNDYPIPSRVRRSFKVSHSYLSLETPGLLAEISPEIFQRERLKAAERVASMVEDVESALATAMQDLIAHMLDRLQPGADGKPRIFRDSLVSNFADFLGTFSARNVAGNSDLEGIAERARQVLAGVDAGTLRAMPMERADVVARFSEIKSSLDAMIAIRPARMFS
jgi:hypothetical protein